MAYLGKAKKCDLLILAEELGCKVTPECRIVDLKKLVLQSEDYDEEFVKEMLDTIINSRLKQENEERERQKEEKEREWQKEEKEREWQKEEKEREWQKEEKERERQKEEREWQKEEKEREWQKEEKEREFQLEKLRIESSNRLNMDAVGQNVIEMNRTPGNNFELHKLMHKFDPKEGDISLYLVIFERQASRTKITRENWVSHLIGLLPCEIIELIAREPEEAANDYNYIKSLLLKRFKLSPDKFRQKFEHHQRTMSSTWRDFSFELTNYFEEWTTGLGITNYDKLKELMIVDQVKRRIPNDVKEHFIDDWSNIVSVNKLADKLDDYENVRGRRIIMDYRNYKSAELNSKTQTNTSVSYEPYPFNRRMNTETRPKRVNNTRTESFDKSFPGKLDSIHSNYTPDNRRFVHQNAHATRDNLKCFNCNDYGHISKDCPKPRSVIICKNWRLI